MIAPDIENLIKKGRDGRLTRIEQNQLALLFEEYRDHALRLEASVHKLVKDLEDIDKAD